MCEAGMDTGAQRATPLIGFGLRPATPAATAPPQLQPTTNSREASTESCVFRKATAASASLIWSSIIVSSTLPSLSPKPRKSMRRLANPSAAQALAARAKIPSFTYPSGGDRLAVRACVAKGVTFELALRSCRDGWEGSRGRAPTALEQGREVSDR